jgi:hypothetical protein
MGLRRASVSTPLIRRITKRLDRLAACSSSRHAKGGPRFSNQTTTPTAGRPAGPPHPIQAVKDQRSAGLAASTSAPPASLRAREVHLPVELPAIAAVIRKRLLPPWLLGFGGQPFESNDDTPPGDFVFALKDSVTVVENRLPRARRGLQARASSSTRCARGRTRDQRAST